MKAYPHLAARLYNAPLLVEPEKAAIIEQVFRAHMIGADVPVKEAEARAQPSAAYAGISFRPNANGAPYPVTEGGVALISVVGTLVNRGSWIDAYSGLVSYDQIAAQLDAAMKDPQVAAVLLEMDSPGGEGSGIIEMTDRIETARGVKPLWGIANESAFSAGYWIVSTCQRVLAPVTGYVGSIGALLLHVDQSKRDSQQGYTYTYIYDGARKIDGNPHQPLSDPARSRMQVEVDRWGLMFREHVARQRAMTEARVRATQAAIINAPAALEAGFIDGIATIAEAVAELEQASAAARRVY